jgi:hypothetical protein
MFRSSRHPLAAATLLLLAVPALGRGQGTTDSSLTYERDVRPIFKALCFRCHGENEKPKARLDLRLVRLMKAGGKSGPVVVPGKLGESLLWERVEVDEMPQGEKKLSAGQKDVIRRWIAQGARTARPEPADPRDARFTEEERSFWAFQPVRRPAIPPVQASDGVRNAVDAFLVARLRDKGLRFAPEADRRTLIRRATFDLLGLPPTPEEVEAFVRDPDPAAYETLIDRLLASPHYGERWGRHWLDAAGYAETDGNVGRDRPRPYAYKYRDYVIRAFNADKTYDQFIREQLAGDEMARRPFDPADPATRELLTATGFLRMAPDVTETATTPADRNQAVADALKVATTSILGLTVGCAQCHDHRYDPITQEDYHRLRAVFDPAFDLKRWKRPSERLFDVTTAAAKQEAERIEALAQKKEADIRRRAEELGRAILDRELARVPDDQRDTVRRAVETALPRRTAEQIALLKKYPRVKEVKFIAGFLVEYDPKAHAAFEKERAEVAKLRATKPATDRIMLVTEEPGRPAESRLFFRGDPEQPKQVVQPGELAILTQHRAGPDLSGAPDRAPASSGRRLAYARWLTDGAHPLVGRAIVNRVWAHHFGRGIVGTPGDFGLAGDRPSHPELLDWLADHFVREGWSLKRLHRLLMTSAAYRQASRRTPELDRIDPDNRLLGRMTIHRLEAEAIRDGLLAVSGDLNPEMGGPSVPVAEDGEGRVILGRQGRQTGGAYAMTAEGIGREGYRRSVYVESRRAAPLGMLETFDLPVMTPNCDARRCSTVAPQALLFLNDQAVLDPAHRLAERLRRERPGDTTGQIRRAFLLLYGAEPTAAETEACRSFLQSLVGHFRGKQPTGAAISLDPERQALASLCQTLLCANRFLYVD